MPLAIPFRIETYERLPSTQDLMRERLESGEGVHGLVIRALEQTAARGQRRRDWWAGPGGSYQTLVVKDSTSPVLNKPHAAILIGLGLAQTLPEYGIQVGIKWPNDLHYRDKKVAGILCEYLRGYLLVAVGMNVNNDVPKGATALRGLDTEGVSNFVLAGMQRGLELMTEEFDLPSAFTPFDVLKGQEIEVELGGQLKRGTADGVDEKGCLRLESGGVVELICHGQVGLSSLRKLGNSNSLPEEGG